MDMSSLQHVNNTPLVNTASSNATASETESFWGKDGFTFGDVVDMFNPLQHLPFVAKYYREQTDDGACEGSRLIGGVLFGALFGGAAGVISSIANSAVRHETQQDMSEHVLQIADESFANLAHITSTQSVNNHTYSVAEAFLNDSTKGFADTSVESSAQITTPSQEIQGIKSQPVASHRDMLNPFFAQILDEYASEQAYSTAQQSALTQRSREWGSV